MEGTTGITYTCYGPSPDLAQLKAIQSLVSSILPVIPYGLCLYRYILYTWGDLCYMAKDGEEIIGVVLSSLQKHHNDLMRGGLEVLVVKNKYRGLGIGTKIVGMIIGAMISSGADEIAIEAETTNIAAIKLYEGLGFIRTKHLHKKFSNSNSAFRMLLPLKSLPEIYYPDCSTADEDEPCECGLYGYVGSSSCSVEEEEDDCLDSNREKALVNRHVL